ncbi:Vps16 C-terminal domain-containing protein [Plasmodiophora brassicae]|uniref:Vps16 C-terminal domain-containing protein n=1 Tax=Plasmodiophora brassicae TaxID=37360 RepID=A0A3P3YI63_PLABS|nr:unnamed protein product [Plasmodiophora brassicae]
MSNPDDDDPFAAFFGAAKADPPVRPATKEQSSPALDLFVGMQQRQPPPAKPMADPFQAAMSAVPGGPRRSVDPFDFNNKAAASVAAFPLDPFREPIRSAIAPANSKSSPSADAFDPFEAISRSSSPIGVKPDPRSPVVEPATSLPGTRPAFPAPANDDEVSQLKAQVKVLQDQLRAEKQRSNAAASLAGNPNANDHSSAGSVVERAIAGDYSGLRSCRSLFKKKQLLAAAIASWNSDVILETVIFLQETVKEHLLMKLLGKEPVAMNSLLSYLERRRQSSALIELYKTLDRLEDVVVHMLNVACAKKDAAARLAAIGEILTFIETQQAEPSDAAKALTFYRDHVAELHRLLERQIAIEGHDQAVAAAGTRPTFTRFPRLNQIGKSVISLLEYCLLFHPDAAKGKLSNGKSIRDDFKVSAKMYTWIALRSYARAGNWNHVAKLVKKTTFTRKAKCVIGFRAFVEAFAEFDGPREEMVKYAAKVQDPEERYELAMQYELFDVAIQALVALKDRRRLEALKPKIEAAFDPNKNGGTVDNVAEVETLCLKVDQAIQQGDKSKWK